jgi:death on curing protein
MSEPIWLSVAEIKDMHSEQLAMFGGGEGMRDEGLLESAVMRPQNQWHYGVSDLALLAANYAFGIAQNHPFIDGNKRVAFAAMMVFLRINDTLFRPPSAEATAIMLSLAAGEIGEQELMGWIRRNWPQQ